MHRPLRSATTRRKKELDKARLATRVTLKNQKGRWDRLKTVLKMKDSEVADILFDTLVHFLITILGLARVSASDRYLEPRPWPSRLWLCRMWCLHTIQV